ncbi:MAG: hypothetical protein ACRDZ7_05175 [Acidimicrobiia bacterium]
MATAAQWLLNTIPTWPLAVLVVGGAMLLAALGHRLVRRWTPPAQNWEHNDVAGAILAVVTGLYGLVLAFVIVAVWDDFQATEKSVTNEATALAQVVRDSNGFPASASLEIRRRVGAYVGDVIDREWELMSEGRESPDADASLATLFEAVQGFQPQTPSEITFHAEVASALNDVVVARRERLFASANSLPEPLAILIVGGAVLCVGALYFLRVPNARAQSVMIQSVTALLAFELLLALLLTNPFAGDVTVSSDPLRRGALANLLAADR